MRLRLAGFVRSVPAILFLVTACARGVGAADPLPNAQNPAPIRTLEAEGGYDWEFRREHEDAFWLRVRYRGSLVRERGTPVKAAQSIDLARPAVPDAGGDRNRWAIRIEDGGTTVGGGLFEAEGVPPLQLRGIDRLDLRGTAYIGGDIDGRIVQVAAGLESPPLQIPRLARAGLTHWLVAGVNAQHQEATDASTGDGEFGLITFRVFTGRGFGWRKSEDPTATARAIQAQLLKDAPTREQGDSLAQKLKAIPAKDRTKLQQLLLDALPEVESEEDWNVAIEDMARGTADAVTDQATVAVYSEVSGWQTFSGERQGTRLKMLATLTADLWLMPTRDDMFVRLRYENGYERARPTVRLNRALASMTLRF